MDKFFTNGAALKFICNPFEMSKTETMEEKIKTKKDIYFFCINIIA